MSKRSKHIQTVTAQPTPAIKAEVPAKGNLLTSTQSIQVSSGPLPSPEILERYEKVYPGLARAIIDGFESEYRHRHEMERLSMSGDISAMELSHADNKRGQDYGLTIAALGILSGSVLVYLGHDWAGATIGAVGLASVVAAFFRGTHTEQTQERTPTPMDPQI